MCLLILKLNQRRNTKKTFWWVFFRVGHSVLFRSVRYVLLRSKKRTLRSFPFFSRVFGDLWDPKERYVLLQRTERTLRSFANNGKERENVPFFCKKKGRTLRSFFEIYIEIYIDIYRHIYIEKRTEHSLKRMERSFYVLVSFFFPRFG